MVHMDTYSKPTVNGEVSSPLNPNDIDVDCDSLFSETSTLRSFQLKNFDSPSNDSKGKEPEYGKGISPVLSPTTPTPYFDPSYLNDKILPTAPGGDEEHDRTHFRRQTPSPGRRKVLKSHRRLPSRTRADASRSPEPTPLEALSGALGPDNVAHTSELDSIPCAGIRIPSGPFMGLLAWRLVVRVHPGRERFFGRHGYKKELALLPHTDIRLAGNMPPPPKKKSSYDDVQQGGPGGGHHGRTMSELGALFPVSQPISRGLGARFPSGSTTSLPLVGKKQSRRSTDPAMEDSEGWSVLPSPHRPFQGTWGSTQSLPMAVGKSSSPKDRRSSWVSGSNNHNHPSAASAPPSAPSSSSTTTTRSRSLEAVVTNFLFDTSQAHNTISRETLQTLGFSDRIIDGLEVSSESDAPKTISLYVQNGGKPITFMLASPGEPSRLGVQFLTESEVNVCMGEGGRGAVIWIDKTAEKKMRLHDVPRTVPLPKLSLQARVRALFGLSS